jgi:4,5-DOPA dioxygenase extradiol
MPVVFIGHGSPMNAIEDNAFSREWKKLGSELPRPEVILAVSAHWFTDGTRVNDEERPKMVYDMYGFPDELYRVDYPAPGAPALAREVKDLLGNAVVDNSWGIDHGTWSVLHSMFPKADIPVFQLSVNSRAPARDH